MEKTISQYLAAVIEAEQDENAGIEYEVSYRGGSYAIPTDSALDIIGVEYGPARDEVEEILPAKIGAGVNYLGGGMRGAVMGTVNSASEHEEHGVPTALATELYKLGEALKQRYIQLENEQGLNDEGDDEEPNWDAMATNSARRAGTVSAY